jgi:hypothetical protein
MNMMEIVAGGGVGKFRSWNRTKCTPRIPPSSSMSAIIIFFLVSSTLVVPTVERLGVNFNSAEK